MFLHGMLKKGSSSILTVLRVIAMINSSGRGHLYFSGSGEMHGSLNDKLMRRLLPSTFALIKNESRGIEDDQIPS